MKMSFIADESQDTMKNLVDSSGSVTRINLCPSTLRLAVGCDSGLVRSASRLFKNQVLNIRLQYIYTFLGLM